MAKAAQLAVEPFEYVLDSDKDLPPDEQSVFTFRPLTQLEQLHAIDSADVATVDAEGNRVFTSRSFAQAYDIVLNHLTKVRNFPAGSPRDWPATKKERIEYLKLFRPIDLFFLGNIVIKKSQLGDEEKKLLAARGHIDFVRQDMGEIVRYDCGQCAEQPYLYAYLGHDGPPQMWWDKNMISDRPLVECPVMTLIKAGKAARELARMEEDYQLYKAGFLKVSGGIVDQPARWLAWMRAIENMIHAVQRAYNQSRPKE